MGDVGKLFLGETAPQSLYGFVRGEETAFVPRHQPPSAGHHHGLGRERRARGQRRSVSGCLGGRKQELGGFPVGFFSTHLLRLLFPSPRCDLQHGAAEGLWRLPKGLSQQPCIGRASPPAAPPAPSLPNHARNSPWDRRTPNSPVQTRLLLCSGDCSCLVCSPSGSAQRLLGTAAAGRPGTRRQRRFAPGVRRLGSPPKTVLKLGVGVPWERVSRGCWCRFPRDVSCRSRVFPRSPVSPVAFPCSHPGCSEGAAV